MSDQLSFPDFPQLEPIWGIPMPPVPMDHGDGHYGFGPDKSRMAFEIFKDLIKEAYRETPSEVSKSKIKQIADLSRTAADTFFESQLKDTLA